MPFFSKKKIRKYTLVLHRDLGYFFSSLIIVYALSGIALNHADDWNPDFIIHKDTIKLKKAYLKSEINESKIIEFGKLVGEKEYKVFDFPTPNQVKIYYEDASFHIKLDMKIAEYERVYKRPLFYQANVLHRNSLKGWRWASDIFAFCLIIITITGLFVIKGKKGISGRGKWLILLGFMPPVIGIILQALL